MNLLSTIFPFLQNALNLTTCSSETTAFMWFSILFMICLYIILSSNMVQLSLKWEKGIATSHTVSETLMMSLSPLPSRHSLVKLNHLRKKDSFICHKY